MKPFCHIYSEQFDDVMKTRKHIFNKHYDYALAQANGDKEQLRKWMELTE